MLPQAAERITTSLRSDALVLQVGAGDEVLERVDWVLDDGPHEPHGGARYTSRTWVERDVCAREPWPFVDGRFDFAICTVLHDLRDPIGVCAELVRVARAGYVELPTLEAELGCGTGRWLCDVTGASLVFVAKPHDPRVRVARRHVDELLPSDRVHALFWESALPAREERPDLDELAERLRARFEPSTAEVALSEARRVGGLAAEVLRRLR
jgi:hypothetical protein